MLVSYYQELIDDLNNQIEIQDKIIANYKVIVEKIEILEELLRRKEEENATLAQKLDRVSTPAAADISVEGAVCDSELSGEGPHT